MKTPKIIYASLLFPLKHIKYFLLIGFLVLLNVILTISPIVISGAYYEVNILSIIVFLFFTIIILGFFIRITHNTIHNIQITEFRWLFNIYEGIKFIFLLFFYFIIPMLILTLVLLISNSFNPSNSFNTALTIGNTTSDLLFNFINYLDFFPDLLLDYIFMPVTESTWIGIILLMFSSLLFVGIGRYADEYNIIRGVDLGTIINIISEIWVEYLLWFISTLLIIFLILIFSYFIGSTLLGTLLNLILIQPFLLMFLARSTGLIYIEIKKLKI